MWPSRVPSTASSCWATPRCANIRPSLCNSSQLANIKCCALHKRLASSGDLHSSGRQARSARSRDFSQRAALDDPSVAIAACSAAAGAEQAAHLELPHLSLQGERLPGGGCVNALSVLLLPCAAHLVMTLGCLAIRENGCLVARTSSLPHLPACLPTCLPSLSPTCLLFATPPVNQAR